MFLKGLWDMVTTFMIWNFCYICRERFQEKDNIVEYLGRFNHSECFIRRGHRK